MKKLLWTSILTFLLTPCVALAAALNENTAVALPTLTPTISVEIMENEYKIELDAYYAEDFPLYSYQAPALTPEEKERAAAARARYAAGERPVSSILNQTEDVTLGVYSLPAEQYQGETIFTLLPCRELTDEELLQLTDAFAALGRAFDPEALSWRNCMRGGGIECTRAFADEEGRRLSSLRELYRRGQATLEEPLDPLPDGDGFGLIRVRQDAYCGMQDFRFLPARRLTDEELLQYAVFGLGDEAGAAAEYAVWEADLRMELHRIFGTPLSAERIGESLFIEEERAVWGSDRQVYSAQFRLMGNEGFEGLSNHDGLLATESGKLASGNIYPVHVPYSDLRCDPFDPKWQDIAVRWVQEHRGDSVQIARAECFGETRLQSSGYGASIRVVMEDGGEYLVRVSFATERPWDIEYDDALRAGKMNEWNLRYVEQLSSR